MALSVLDLYPEPSLESTLKGHKQSVNCISFSPDGQQLVSGSDDNSVILWSLKVKQPVCYRLTGHSNSILSVAFSQNYFLSSSKDCTVRLWKLNQIRKANQQNQSIVYRCHASSVRSVDIHPDGNQFCTASDDKTVKIWSSSGPNKFISSLSGVHCNWVRCAKYSSLNHHLIASCGDDGLVCIWDTRTKDAAIKLESKRRSAHYLSLAWHPVHEQLLATSSGDSSIRIWDLKQKKTIQYYAAHDSPVNCIDFHSTGNYLLSSSSDEKCKIFDLLEGRVLFTLNAHNGAVNSAVFSFDSEYFATAGHDRQIQFWKSNLLYDHEENQSIFTDNFNSYDDEIELSSSHHSSPSMKSSLKSVLRKNSCETYSEEKQLSPRKVRYQSGETIPNEALGICHRILSQLQVLTESVSMIEKRLSKLEGRFDAHCTAENGFDHLKNVDF